MRKRILSWALVLCMVLALVPGAALAADDTVIPYAVTEDGTVNIYFDTASGTITACDKTATKIIIPAEIKGIKIAKIGARAFEGCNNLSEIYFKGNAPEFADNAFAGLKQATIYVPNGDVTWTPANMKDYGGNWLFWARWCANGHSGEWVVTKEATCTEQGWKQRVCTICGANEWEEIPMLSHTPVAFGEAKEATCEEAGLTQGIQCSVCETVLVAQKVVPALGHKTKTVTIDPTCTEDGKTITVCLRCEKVLENEALAKLPHTVVTDEAVAPTCNKTGLTEGSHCKVCGEVIVAQTEIPMVNHQFSDWKVTKQPTCTEAGEQTRKCAVCGLVETEVIEALGHVHASDAAALDSKKATCTEDGYARYLCTRCNLAYNEVVEATGHNQELCKIVAATCTKDGSIKGVCPDCLAVINETIPTTGHQVETWTVTVKPTCTKNGVQEGFCPVCKDNVNESIPALGHDYRASVTKPTCTEQGYTTHACAICGDSYVDSKVDALGHNFAKWEQTKAPTCTEAGEESAICLTCGTIEHREIEALTHNVEAWEATKAPTCTEAGEESGVCTVCEETVTRELEALGHKWDDGKVTTEPAATTDGVKTYTCTVCGETRTEAIPATGEQPIDPVKPIDPTTVFTDVSHDWAYPGIEYCYNHGLMAGTSETTFSPEEALTRGQFVAILWRQLGCPAPKGENPFTDLTQDYYKDAITWAAENKVVYGTDETTFEPDRAITRQELTTMFYRYVGEYLKQDVSGAADIRTFPDYSSVADYAQAAMAWAKGVGLITGNEIGSTIYLDPLGAATRAQAATMFMNLCERVLK